MYYEAGTDGIVISEPCCLDFPSLRAAVRAVPPNAIKPAARNPMWIAL